MTSEEILKTLEKGESLIVEFKDEPKAPISDTGIVEDVICMANSNGGYIFIGVNDSGKITGAKPRHEDRIDAARMQAMVFNNTVPNLSVNIDVVEIQDENVIVINVPQSKVPVGTAKGKYQKRVILSDGKPACIPWFIHQMTADTVERGEVDYSSNKMIECSENDLDPIEFNRLRTFMKNSATAHKYLLELSDKELAGALGLMSSSHPTIAGLLILGKEEAIAQNIPTHEVAFQMFSGLDLQINNFMKTPLLKSLEIIMGYFNSHNKEKEMMLPVGIRHGIPDYSPSGFREGVINSLVHRNYSKIGGILVQWFEDRIEITNPGGFVEGITIDNILVTPPKPRNRTLADVFNRIGLVERSGRGVDSIYQGQIRYGRPIPDYTRTTPNDVVLVLNGGSANLEFASFIIENERSGNPLDINEMLILNELQREKNIDMARARKLTQQQSDSAIRATFSKLMDRGYIEKRGDKKWRTYHLSSMLYNVLGKPLQYTKQRGFDRLQQEQMVMQHVSEYGQIKKREVVELCNITQNQAVALLRRLIKSGKLQLIGERKAAFYVLKKDYNTVL